MRSPHPRLLAVSISLLLVLTGCASEHAGTDAANSDENGTTVEQTVTDQDAETADQGSDTTIPSGAYAASPEFPFPIPEGWQIIHPFTEGTLGADASVDGSVEYPGDAADAAATYLTVLEAAGFTASTYGPGELTNQASLVANGTINGIPRTAILNFDVHADGLQHVSITVVDDD